MEVGQNNLAELGWDSFFTEHYELLKVPGSIPARVVSEERGSYQVYGRYGELSAEVSGRMRYQALAGELYPVIGDWVVITPDISQKKGVIHAVLPRKSRFSRKMAGPRTEEQVVAANVDTVFIVSGLDGGRNLNLRRTERYLALAWSSGAIPVIVLNKVDLCPDVEGCVRDVEPVATGVAVHPISATERIGLDALWQYLARGKTAAFLGSSGVGKSALINVLLGTDRQKVGSIRQSDGKGRHTTSRRELILLPGGGVVIDTPGMREIQMWTEEDSPYGAFGDIGTLAGECRFKDCRHLTEPGCAVKTAIERGELEAARLKSYRKLQRELRHLAARQNNRVRLEEKARWR
ncbi:MAG: ribosome small subunit-dependent GTPase A, partial [Dehalococcoidales bacterium]